MFTSSVYKMNYLLVPTSVLSSMIQNNVDVIHIATLDAKWKRDDSCIDHEEAVIGFL